MELEGLRVSLGGEGAAVNIIDGPGPSEEAMVVLGVGFEVNLAPLARRVGRGRVGG